MRVVIVEDEGITAFFLKEVVESLGHEVLGLFAHSDDLLTLLDQKPEIDLIFMDIQIKGPLDGITLAQKAHRKDPRIKFVFVTSYKDTQTIQGAQAVQPLGYLLKPVLEESIEAVLMVVKATLDHTAPAPLSTEVVFDAYRYDTQTKVMYHADETLSLSKNERACIDALVKYKNSYVSVEQLIGAIWEGESNREESLRELVYRLRKKIPALPLSATPKVGYLLKVY